jgi:hypothetical protein
MSAEMSPPSAEGIHGDLSVPAPASPRTLVDAVREAFGGPLKSAGGGDCVGCGS